MPLEQLADGRWRLRWYRDGRKAGPREQVTLPAGTTAAEASNLYKRKLAVAAARAGRMIPARLTLKTLAEAYLDSAEPRVIATTNAVRRRIFKLHILPTLGDLRVERLRPYHVEEYQRKRQAEGAAIGTINYEVRLLRTAVRRALAWGWIDRDPIPSGAAPALPGSSHRTDYLRPEEWDLLLDHVTPYAAPMLRLMLLTGARPSEAVALTWADVDLDNGLVTLAMNKLHGRPKTLPLAGALGEFIRALPRGTPAAPLVPHPSAGHWHVVTLATHFRNARDAAGLRQSLTLYSVRHTFASWLAAAGTATATIKDALGHANIGTTMRYVHLQPEHLRGAMETVQAVEKSGQSQYRRHGTTPSSGE